jgi:hypothetical protein
LSSRTLSFEVKEEEITNLFQQVLNLQNQLPPTPEEADPMSEVDDD